MPKKENKEKRGIIYFLSAFKQIQLLLQYLNNQSANANGSIYVDSRFYQDRELLESFLLIQERTWKGGEENPYYEDAKKLLTKITFANKQSLSSGLEVTDFISFVTFAHIRRKMSQFSDIRLNKVWQTIKQKLKDDKFHEVNEEDAIRFL